MVFHTLIKSPWVTIRLYKCHVTLIFYMTAFGNFEGVKVSDISVFLEPGIRIIHGHYFI